LDPWPGEVWNSSSNLTFLGPSNPTTNWSQNLSSAYWNPLSRRLWVADNTGVFSVLKEDGAGSFTNERDYFVQGANDWPLSTADLEGITQGTDTNRIYLLHERINMIREYSVSTGVTNRWWDLTPLVGDVGYWSSSRDCYDGNDGTEGLTYIPDAWLAASGFRDGNGNLFAHSSYGPDGLGGIMLVGVQHYTTNTTGFVYAVDLSTNNNVWQLVGRYRTAPRGDSCDLAFDASIGRLYILHNSVNASPQTNTIEVTDLTSAADGPDRKFTTLNEFAVPCASNIEGFAIAPALTSSNTLGDKWCFFANDDGWVDDMPDALRWFGQFPAPLSIFAGSNQSALVSNTVPVPPSVLLRDAFQNPLTNVSVTFTVTSGAGSVTGASAMTGTNGVATVGSWRLGPGQGTNTLSASVIGAGVSTVTFIAYGIDTNSSVPPLAQYVIVISVDGMGSEYVKPLLTNGCPNELTTFKRFQAEGAGTLNARDDVDWTVTLPNHVTMMTSRGVEGAFGHSWNYNGYPDGLSGATTLEQKKGTYVASGFDVAHDNGLRTGIWAGKSRFALFQASYGATSGAEDVTGPDNGRDKIDRDTIMAGTNAASLTADFTNQMTASPFNFVFLHYQDPDWTGHYGGGWSTNPTSPFATTLKSVDAQVGIILQMVEASPTLQGRTALILTADHGGYGYDHSVATNYLNFTIPFYVWGPGVQAGGDLYSINAPHRASPDPAQNPSYTNAVQPVRNGEAANLALDLLGLGPVTNSTLDYAQDLVVAGGVAQVTLTVVSDWGGSYPGTVTTNQGASLSIYVTNSPVMNGTTRYVADGGSVVSNAYNLESATNITLTLTNDATLTWDWRTQYVLHASAGLNGWVDQAEQWVDSGSSGTVTAGASNYYHFGGWSGDTNGCTTNADQITVPMAAPRQVVASFSANMATNNTPHWWLVQYNLETNDTDALHDDGDDMPAWQEYLAGTDPTNADSVLAVTNITVSGAGVRVDWKGGSEVTQYLETRASLATGEWTAIRTNAPSTPTATNYTHSSSNPAGFYRIRAVR
jgi:hypothetical protein